MIISILAKDYSENSEVFLIGVRGISTTKIWKLWDFENESEMLKDFIEYFTGIDDKIIIGYNILKFDILKLALNSKGLENFGKFFKKLNISNIVDLFVILTFLNKGMIKGLNSYCEQYDIQKRITSERDLLNLYKDKRYEELVKLFSEKLDAINELFLKMWDKAKHGIVF